VKKDWWGVGWGGAHNRNRRVLNKYNAKKEPHNTDLKLATNKGGAQMEIKSTVRFQS